MGEGGEDAPRAPVWSREKMNFAKPTGPCLDRTAYAMILGGAAGTFFGACQVAWYPDPITLPKRFGGHTERSDFRAVLRQIARPALFWTATATAFAAAECVAESVRGKSDSVNAGIGGMAAGVVIGATTRRFDIMTSAALGVGLLLYVVDYSQSNKNPYVDESRFQCHGVLPEKHRESKRLSELKEIYPQHKDL